MTQKHSSENDDLLFEGFIHGLFHMTPAAVVGFLHGEGSREAMRRWEKHLETCHECTELVESVRRATRPASRDEIQRVVDRLRVRMNLEGAWPRLSEVIEAPMGWIRNLDGSFAKTIISGFLEVVRSVAEPEPLAVMGAPERIYERDLSSVLRDWGLAGRFQSLKLIFRMGARSAVSAELLPRGEDIGPGFPATVLEIRIFDRTGKRPLAAPLRLRIGHDIRSGEEGIELTDELERMEAVVTCVLRDAAEDDEEGDR